MSSHSSRFSSSASPSSFFLDLASPIKAENFVLEKMSNASKTKSGDKKVMNDSKKTPSKASGSMSASAGFLAAYNPLLGTFQTIESLSTTGASSLHCNGRFRNIDESDSTGGDCDSVSNNGSWSGDSEDHKEKLPNTATKQEAIPGADNDKREKMRLKNERKHQRQKEKRAQELHERCCQYLMSRKLEVLAQQLILMGISHERATYALMLNEGKIEESINWLFDDGGAKVSDKQLDPTSGKLKLDISQELGSILELETKYKCTKKDVERAVVTAEGDIEKAEESLRRQKQDQSTASRKAEEISDVNNGKTPCVHTSQSTVVQLQPNSGMYTAGGEEALDRKNASYPRGSSYNSGESGNQSVNSLDKIHMKLQWLKMQQQNAVVEEKKRMLYQQTPLPRPTGEKHYLPALSDQFKRVQQQEMREPATVMQQQQQSQSAHTNVLPVSTMNPSFTGAAAATGSWYPASRSEAIQSNGYSSTRTLTPKDLNSNLMYQQAQYQQYQGQVNNSHRMGGGFGAVAVAPAASLGLFSGYGSVSASRSTSGLDWNTDGSMGKLDYENIDWSLDKGLACPRPSQQYVAASPYESSYMNGRTRMMANGNSMGMAMGVHDAASVGNGREWTSPFEGKDLFSLSRQFVPPSL